MLLSIRLIGLGRIEQNLFGGLVLHATNAIIEVHIAGHKEYSITRLQQSVALGRPKIASLAFREEFRSEPP